LTYSLGNTGVKWMIKYNYESLVWFVLTKYY